MSAVASVKMKEFILYPTFRCDGCCVKWPAPSVVYSCEWQWWTVRLVSYNCSDKHRLRELGIPRSLFRLTSAFDNFKAVDPVYDDDFFGERNTLVKFVDEPQTIGDEDTIPLISSGKAVIDEIALTKLNRRWRGGSSPRSSPPRQSSFIPSIIVPSTIGYFRKLTLTFFPGVVDPPEPNEHTTEDHYRMNCEELDVEDAIEPLHDEMMMRKAWLLLELMPMKRTWQERGKWRSSFWWVSHNDSFDASD